MLDLRAPELPVEDGEHLARDVYRRDFLHREQAIRGGESWKLERSQHFEEAGSPSRDALRRGDWPEALRHMAARADALRTEALDDQRRGSVFHRLRVVEEPLTPYLQWELHSLRQQALFGQRVRVVLSGEVAAAEAAGPLPELVVLDDRTLYRVLYSAAGVARGAVRWTDPGIVRPWAAYIRGVYALGEDVLTYFERVVAPLPAPPAA
jgi:hypothetical protein